jgi:nitrate/TMAO reductase-like tetraheme cytochrome c subunit
MNQQTTTCPDCDLRQKLADAQIQAEADADADRFYGKTDGGDDEPEAVRKLSAAVDKLKAMKIISHEEMQCRVCDNIVFIPDF